MNRTKLNIMKRVLGINQWKVKKDKNNPSYFFVFNGSNEIIMVFNKNIEHLYVHYKMLNLLTDSFKFGFSCTTIMLETIMEEQFNWGVEKVKTTSRADTHIRWKNVFNRLKNE